MILKGNQRGGALQLAQHLLNSADNDHVSVEDVRGFAAETLIGAMQEALAISKGTQCRQFLFSVSLNPPEDQTVAPDAFGEAADRIERKLGLTDQPRALVIHEKDGRRHAHAIWSRVDTDSMTAINLPHTKLKLRDVSKALFREHGWDMPPGLSDSAQRNPFNFSREEWQQSKRVGQDAKAIKALFKDCWTRSDTGRALKAALSEHGFLAAKGDRRSVVALDYRGEVYALARWAGVKTKEVRERFGDPSALPDIETTKAMIAERMTAMITRHIDDTQTSLKRGSATVRLKAAQLKERHVAERAALDEVQTERWARETMERAARFRTGLGGVWDRFSGKHRKIRQRNEDDARTAEARDAQERQALASTQLNQRRALHKDVKAMRSHHHEELAKLRADVATYAGRAGDFPTKAPGFRPGSSQKPTDAVAELGRGPRNTRDRDFSR